MSGKYILERNVSVLVTDSNGMDAVTITITRIYMSDILRLNDLHMQYFLARPLNVFLHSNVLVQSLPLLVEFPIELFSNIINGQTFFKIL